jgi:hypothetical protein
MSAEDVVFAAIAATYVTDPTLGSAVTVLSSDRDAHFARTTARRVVPLRFP